VNAPLARLPYLAVCTGLGLALGWVPLLLHGPIPEKFDVLYINGSLAVWGFYLGRCAIGFWVGVSTWPARWWIRGPLLGFVSMLPLGIVLLATPGCGTLCFRLNMSSAIALGFANAGLAFLLTGRHRAP
jgi:hypothetical protein